MDHDEEIWLVQLPNGAVRAMTLDELDAAYQEGAIDEETFIRRDGASKWSKLRDELGGDEPAVPAYPAVQQQPLYSTRPVVSELDLDELELGSPFKKSRKGTYATIGGIALVAVAAAAFGATKMSSASAASANASIANAAQPPAVVVSPPPTPQPAVTLTEGQKKALADLDKKHEKTWEQRRQSREHAATPHYHPSHTPFHKGGNKYDPLNAKL